MATLAAGAPLLAGGPPGWALYGLLAVGTIVVGAIVVSNASRTAEQTFPTSRPGCVQGCPRTGEETQPRAQPRPVPIPVPIPREEPRRRTCATDHPGIPLCASLPGRYTHASIQAAFRAVQQQYPGRTLRLEKTRAATRGPCPGVGTHTGIRAGGAYLASVVCCPCCTDTATGPIQWTKCGVV